MLEEYEEGFANTMKINLYARVSSLKQMRCGRMQGTLSSLKYETRIYQLRHITLGGMTVSDDQVGNLVSLHHP